MIKRVLLPLDQTQDSHIAIQYGLDLHRRHKSFLSAVSVIDVEGIEASTVSMGIGSSSFAKEGREQLLKEDEQDAQAILTHFAKVCAAEGIANVDRAVLSAPTKAILHSARFYDLVLMGLSALPSHTKEDPNATIKSVIQKSSSPVLGVPSRYRGIKRALIAFDGSDSSAKAMHLFALLNPFELDELRIISVTERDSVEQTERNLASAGEFWRAYGVRPTTEMLSGDPKHVIPEYAKDEGFDLIVIGPNSSSKISQFFFGSLTNELLSSGDFALFMYR